MITEKFSRTLSLILIIILIFGGCGINMVNSTPTQVRMLISGVGQPHILMELIHDDIFVVTKFLNSWISESELEALNENITRDGLVDDFISIDPHLYEMFENPLHDSSVLVVHEIVASMEIKLSQQQLKNISKLVDNIANNNPSEVFEPTLFATETPHIWVIINGKFYWSLYFHHSARHYLNNPSINNNVVMLADELTSLADVSPFRSGR